MEISNLQKIGKNKVVQRTSTCLSPIVKILPFWFYHLLLFFSFFFFACFFTFPEISFTLVHFRGHRCLLWHWHDIFLKNTVFCSSPLFNRMFFILGFLVRLRLCVPGHNTTLVILCRQVSGIQGPSALRWRCSFWSLGQGGVQFVRCIFYVFFLPCI